jgi:DNA (cytosine-5)-methyltransferase 1
LFYIYIDILNYLKIVSPNIKFFLENVKMDIDSENTFNEMTKVKPYKINLNLISAQNRQRNYWTNIDGFVLP